MRGATGSGSAALGTSWAEAAPPAFGAGAPVPASGGAGCGGGWLALGTCGWPTLGTCGAGLAAAERASNNIAEPTMPRSRETRGDIPAGQSYAARATEGSSSVLLPSLRER